MKWKKFVKINFGRYICGGKQRNNAEYFTIRVSNAPPRISGGGYFVDSQYVTKG